METGTTPGAAASEVHPVTIVIADDHPLFRDGLRGLLATTSDLQVVGEATSGEEVLALSARLAPHVVLMDIRMPGISGIEATRRLMDAGTTPRILIVTMFEDDASVFAAMRAGARGYVLKDASKDDMLRAIRAVGRGEAIFSPAIATRVIDAFTRTPPAAPRAAFPMLTERERELLHLLARGASNAEIARALSLSGKTVANYVSSILTKLQVVDRAEAMARAREAGLG